MKNDLKDLCLKSYGYFDDENREYVITRPDTPRPWTNYSGDRTYGAVYSQHGSGYAFTQSPATGRLLRFSYTAPPASQPGRFLYLRDVADGDFWSASWLPVAKPLEHYQTTCRMGTSYITLSSRYRDIASEMTCFVPLGKAFEYWVLKVTNEGSQPRRIQTFSYAEFTSVWDILHEEFNQQYANAISQCRWVDGMAAGGNMIHLPADIFAERHQSRWWYMLQAGDAAVVGYDLERDTFLGPAGSYAAPRAVVEGRCRGSEAYGDTPCVALQSELELQPGETKTLVFLLGPGKAEDIGVSVRAEYATPARAAQELAHLKKHWHGLLGRGRVNTPDPAFNSMVNVWNPYNALMTFEWSRACSFVYTGIDRDGFGFRDTVQDIMAVLPAIPERARDRLLLMLSGQESKGGAQPVVDPVSFRAGAMPPVNPAVQRADDCLWFFNTVPAYVAETGDLAFYGEVVSFADGGEGTVYEHLRRAIAFSLAHQGRHGLACGLSADWNDCIKLGFHGESIFVSLQLRLALSVFRGVAERLAKADDQVWAEQHLQVLDAALQAHAWDGQWFLRAFPEDGSVFGSATSDEGQIFLNPQSWAVLSGAATPEQAESAMDHVDRLLATEYGCVLHASPYRHIGREVMHGVVYLPGTKENAAVFQHTQAWAVMADCMLGHGDRAYRNLCAYLPAAQNERAEQRQVEPYVFAQWTHAAPSPHAGRSRVPWLSGTAAWTYFAATHYVLGIRPELDGLRLDPCIPSTWKGFTAERLFRGKRLRIVVENPDGVQRGVRKLRLDDGTVIIGNLLPADRLRDGMELTVVMQ